MKQVIFKSLSLRKKLIISVLLCLLIPTAITVSVSSFFIQNMLKDNIETHVQQSLESVNYYVSDLLEEMVYVTNFIQFDSEMNSLIRQVLNRNHHESPDNIYLINQMKAYDIMREITFLRKKAYITILLKDGTYFTNYEAREYNPVQLFKEPWFKELGSLAPFETKWLGMHQAYISSEKTEHPYFFTLVRTIKYFSNEPTGYIIVSISQQEIAQLLNRAGSDEQVMIADSNQTILVHSDTSRIGEHLTVPTKNTETDELTVIEQNNKDYVMMNKILPITQWSIINLSPYENMFGELNRIMNLNFLVQSIIIFVFFLALLIYLVHRQIKPLSILVRTATKVQMGQLEVRSGIRGHGEIGKLGHAFDTMLQRIEEMIVQIKQEQIKKRSAELEMLQAQIKPHFLFNVLNSIRLRILMKGDEENAETVHSLSSLLRMTINRNNENIPLNEEVETVKYYFNILNFRQREQIYFETILAKDTLMVELPRFFLQPLIENAIIHGLDQKSGKIRVTSYRTVKQLIIIVEDSGKGIKEEKIKALRNQILVDDPPHKKSFSGVGLKNVFDRMKIIYGEEFDMTIGKNFENGTMIQLSFPIKHKREELE